jgi:hypothetical protein
MLEVDHWWTQCRKTWQSGIFRLLAAVAAQSDDEYSDQTFWLSPVPRRNAVAFPRMRADVCGPYSTAGNNRSEGRTDGSRIPDFVS